MKNKKKFKKTLTVIIIAAIILSAVVAWLSVRLFSTVECTVFNGKAKEVYQEDEKVFAAMSLSYLVYGLEGCENASGTVENILDTQKMGIIIENADISRKDKTNPETALIDSASFIRQHTKNYRFLTELKDEKSSFYGAAFADDENKVVWISYSGSVSFTDAIQSALLAVGAGLSRQEKCAFELYEKVLECEEIKNGYDLILTGHSLGGALASMVAYVGKAEAFTISGADGLALRKIKTIAIERNEDFSITNYLTSPKGSGFSIKDCIQRMMFWGDYDGIECHTYENNGMVDNSHCVFGFVKFEDEGLTKPFLPEELTD